MTRTLLLTSLSAATLAIVLTACTPEVIPPELPTPDVLSEVHTEELLDEHLDQIWSMTGLPDTERPEVERVRFIQPNEWATSIAECMAADGFNARAENGGLILENADEQRSATSVAQYICEARFPVEAIYYQALNESQLRYLYHYQTTDLRPCLEAEGYEISNPPSFDTYFENYSRNGGWLPYAEIPGNMQPSLEELCPQLPQGLWG
ncbi:hypothetical protein [Agromyces laixinhei]|uniref:hypothetical protein n=1 Tax=Agromyces laixinhei TaxID=2585717 RepID=UPI0012EE0B2C|nr:hypothetical protein [Agromyces laixinhei]